MNKRRVLIVGMDGMRPDLVRPDLMPTLAGLTKRGVRLADHHAVYPTHTRANISSLATGVHPGQHGVMANVFYLPESTDSGIINTAEYDDILTLDRVTNGNGLMVPTLGDLLDEHGSRLAVAATSSEGAGILWTRNHPYRVVNVNSDYGRSDLSALREKLGTIPPAGPEFRLERQMYAARAVTDLFLEDAEISVVVFWMNEPDASQHFYGLGAPEVNVALSAADSALGHVLDRLRAQGLEDQFDIFVISDHGHSSVQRHSSLTELLDRASKELPIIADLDLRVASDYIYAPGGSNKDRRAHEMEPLVRWIQEQAWAGAVLGSGDLARLPGVLPLATVWADQDNPRHPLLAVSPAWSDQKNDNGVAGTIAALTDQVALRSTHGSASPYDLHAFALAAGSSFRSGAVSELPTGAIDLAPTVLQLLGLESPAPMDGRIWWEAFEHPSGEPGNCRSETIYPELPHPDSFAPTIRLHRVGDAKHLDRITTAIP